MSKKKNEIKALFEDIWHKLKPLLVEWLVYLFIIFTFVIASNYAEPYIEDEVLKKAVHMFKLIGAVGALGLFFVHTFVAIFIMVGVDVIEMGKNGYKRIKQNRKTKRKALKSKPANFDKASEIQNSKKTVTNEE